MRIILLQIIPLSLITYIILRAFFYRAIFTSNVNCETQLYFAVLRLKFQKEKIEKILYTNIIFFLKNYSVQWIHIYKDYKREYRSRSNLIPFLTNGQPRHETQNDIMMTLFKSHFGKRFFLYITIYLFYCSHNIPTIFKQHKCFENYLKRLSYIKCFNLWFLNYFCPDNFYMWWIKSWFIMSFMFYLGRVAREFLRIY